MHSGLEKINSFRNPGEWDLDGKRPILGAETTGRSRSDDRTVESNEAWWWIGWFGGILFLVGASDVALAWIPLNLGNLDWEFGTVSASLAALPLVTMGAAAMFGSTIARGKKAATGVLSLVFFGVGLWVLASFGLFALDIAPAIRAVGEGPGRLVLNKAIVKTSMMAVLFGPGYLFAGYAGVKFWKGKSNEGN